MKLSRKWSGYAVSLFSLAAGLVIAFPLIYAVLAGFKTESELGAGLSGILPHSFTHWDNYRKVLLDTMIVRFMLNSLFIALIMTIIRLLLSTLAAYAFAFFRFPGKNLLFFLILGTMMIPSEAVLIANFITVSKMHLLNTYSGIMIVYAVSATQVFMFRQYFRVISGTLREAAFIDGCGDLHFYGRICLPVSLPIVTSLGLSSFVALWNTYLWPLLVTTTEEMRTVQVGITLLTAHEGSNDTLVFAGITLILIPSLLFFVFFQRNIVSGMFSGAVKG